MTPNEQRKAIAEFRGLEQKFAIWKGDYFYRPGEHGYTQDIKEAGRYTKDEAQKLLVKGEPMGITSLPFPDYLNDLNAMHEAESGVFNKKQWHTYTDFLIDVVLPKDQSPIRATAAQRAEALLRTIGKWKE